jgi:hypothetical protein
MRTSDKIITLLGVAVLAASASGAGVFQATREGGELYAVQGRETLRIGRLGGIEEEVEIPAGASIQDLEPTGSGWLAAGHSPTPEGTELLVLEESEGTINLLPVPQVAGAKLSGQPILLIQDDSLAGLVWAAGNELRGLDIWAAQWLHGKWGEPELVSPKGPGSQLAPRAVVLDDGSWLVVWAAFDGEDDEVVWSRRIQGEWTKPARVAGDNAVPDITPALAAIDGGALLAWSWYDGNDYRMKTARFFGDKWTEAKSFGEKGSLYPSLIQTDDGGQLLYKTVEPASWTVLAFDRQGIATRRAVIEGDTEDRPLVAIDEGKGALLRWQAADGSFDLERDRAAAWQELP